MILRCAHLVEYITLLASKVKVTMMDAFGHSAKMHRLTPTENLSEQRQAFSTTETWLICDWYQYYYD